MPRVSVSTVSYVLTGTRPISEATRDRVLAAMAELDYQPNAMARGLATRRSRIVGLLMPMDERGLGATETAFVTGAAAAASARGLPPRALAGRRRDLDVAAAAGHPGHVRRASC